MSALRLTVRVLLVVGFAIGSLPTLQAAGDSSSPLAGKWRIDLSRSTELSPWKGYDFTLSIDGDVVTLQRQLGWGRRQFSDTIKIDTASANNVVPVEMWPDNRHLGAYIGGDKTMQVRAEWIDDRRILRLSTDLVLDTQQGSRAVNILSDYKASANGTELVLTELRSTRNRPIVYRFTRAGSDSK
jgi:hypothetical protein